MAGRLVLVFRLLEYVLEECPRTLGRQLPPALATTLACSLSRGILRLMGGIFDQVSKVQQCKAGQSEAWMRLELDPAGMREPSATICRIALLKELQCGNNGTLLAVFSPMDKPALVLRGVTNGCCWCRPLSEVGPGDMMMLPACRCLIAMMSCRPSRSGS